MRHTFTYPLFFDPLFPPPTLRAAQHRSQAALSHPLAMVSGGRRHVVVASDHVETSSETATSRVAVACGHVESGSESGHVESESESGHVESESGHVESGVGGGRRRRVEVRGRRSPRSHAHTPSRRGGSGTCAR